MQGPWVWSPVLGEDTGGPLSPCREVALDVDMPLLSPVSPHMAAWCKRFGVGRWKGQPRPASEYHSLTL